MVQIDPGRNRKPAILTAATIGAAGALGAAESGPGTASGPCGMLAGTVVPLALVLGLLSLSLLWRRLHRCGQPTPVSGSSSGRAGPLTDRVPDGASLPADTAAPCNRFCDLLETAAGDGVIVFGPDGRIACWSRAAERILGFSACEAVDRKPEEFLFGVQDGHPISLPWDEIRESARGASAGVLRELNLRRKDEAAVAVEISFGAIGDARRQDVVAIVRDISYRKAKERAIQEHIQAMESLQWGLTAARDDALVQARAKSAVLDNVAQRLRIPLSEIVGYADQLADEFDAPRVQRLAAAIRQNGEELFALLGDLVETSHSEAGGPRSESADCELTGLIGEVLATFTPQAAEKGVVLDVVFDSLVPERIISDTPRLRQILFNLVSNAVKFTSQGKVELSVRWVQDGDGLGWLQCDVMDTGIGIPPEAMDRIFAPFEQADASTSARYGGSGMGLAVSRRLAELMGGELVAWSEVGRGSTFRLKLPTGPLEGGSLLPPEQALAQARASGRTVGQEQPVELAR